VTLRRTLVASAAVMLTAAGLLAPSASAAPEAPAAPALPVAPASGAVAKDKTYTPQPIAWGTCSSQVLNDNGFQCGSLKVPLDYGKPGGTKITLALTRIKHTAKRYQGVMLTNPGGPGGSGLTLPILSQYVPDGVGAEYDWIGFDPRGVGQSEPAVSCDPGYEGYDRPRYVPSSPAIEQAWFDRSNAYTEACAKNNGAILDHLTTLDTVKDMESIRKALGRKKINYYGFSYGTYLGQVYGTKYPDRLRRVIFDGTVDPRDVWYDANLEQNKAFEVTIDAWFAWVAKNDAAYHLGTTEKAVRLAFYRAQDALYDDPAQGQGGRIGGSEWNDTFLSAGYYVYGWNDLAQAFSNWVNKGDISGVEANFGFDASDPQADNGYAVYLGVQCTDTSWPQRWSRWESDAWRIFARAPFETWANTWFNEPCRHWPGQVEKPVKIKGKKVKSLLMINETLDAATPYAGSLEVRKRFGKARLIEGVGGTTHAGSLSGVACVDDRIARYLDDGSLPKRKSGRRSDVKCDPVPAPAATSPDARAKRTADQSRYALLAQLKKESLPR
jgi:pimeloyl-ACP methyl ester carboxylesterase